MPLGRVSGEKGDYMVGDLPWGMRGWSHILGAPVLVSDTGNARRAAGTKGRAVGSLDSTHEEHKVGLLPRQEERWIGCCSSGCSLPCDQFNIWPRLSSANTPTQPTSRQSSVPEWGLQRSGKGCEEGGALLHCQWGVNWCSYYGKQ